MTVSVVFRQRLIFVGMLTVVIIITHLAYHRINPEWIVYRQADHQFRREHWHAAIALYEESFAKGLNYPTAMLRIAHASTEVKDYPKAIHWYEAYLTIKPRDRSVRRALAGVLTANGDFARAAEEYRRVIQEESRHHDEAK